MGQSTPLLHARVIALLACCAPKLQLPPIGTYRVGQLEPIVLANWNLSCWPRASMTLCCTNVSGYNFAASQNFTNFTPTPTQKQSTHPDGQGLNTPPWSGVVPRFYWNIAVNPDMVGPGCVCVCVCVGWVCTACVGWVCTACVGWGLV